MSRPPWAMTKGAHMWVKVGAPVRSFAPNSQRKCVPRGEPMPMPIPMQLMAAANLVVETIPDLKLPFMPAAANARSPLLTALGGGVSYTFNLCGLCSISPAGNSALPWTNAPLTAGLLKNLSNAPTSVSFIVSAAGYSYGSSAPWGVSCLQRCSWRVLRQRNLARWQTWYPEATRRTQAQNLCGAQ